jgi:hypothetical protein
MSITLQLKSIERRLGVLLSSNSCVLQSSNAGDEIVWGFEGLCKLLIRIIQNNRPEFKPVNGTLELTAAIKSINYWFRFYEHCVDDEFIEIYYQLGTSGGFEGPRLLYRHYDGKLKGTTIIIQYISHWVNALRTAVKNAENDAEFAFGGTSQAEVIFQQLCSEIVDAIMRAVTGYTFVVSLERPQLKWTHEGVDFEFSFFYGGINGRDILIEYRIETNRGFTGERQTHTHTHGNKNFSDFVAYLNRCVLLGINANKFYTRPPTGDDWGP